MTTYDVYVNDRKDQSFADGLLAQKRMDVIDRTCRGKKPVAMVVHFGKTRVIRFKSGKQTVIEVRKTEAGS